MGGGGWGSAIMVAFLGGVVPFVMVLEWAFSVLLLIILYMCIVAVFPTRVWSAVDVSRVFAVDL